ncbi:MAG: sensor histidine kinase [Velocimicrobium sp.]
MKRSRFLNTVQRKYAVGYAMVGLFVIVFLLTTVIGNIYVSSQYSTATAELVDVNNLEKAVNNLNDSINLTYLYLSVSGVEEYFQSKEEVEKYLKKTKLQLNKRFVREMADTNTTVETYISKSDNLLEKLQEYINSNERNNRNYEELESQYNELQEVYSYINLRFQNVYSEKLNILSEMEEQLRVLQNAITIFQVSILVIMVICCAIYLYKVIRKVSISIATMMNGVKSIEKDVFQAESIQIGSNDEFDEFASAFNSMIKIIQQQLRKIEENADIKEQLAAAEIENLRIYSDLQKNHLDFLQSRINPHFLFNTLNMISSQARLENADKSAELMEITASFLRYNLDNISKTVTLEKEMKHLKDYVTIQEYRYGGRYVFFFDVEEQCLNFSMPCMILQPLVENAMQHGIAMKLSDGCVWIKAYKSDGRICLEVRDNGVGMTEEQIHDIYKDFHENNSSNTHIGLRNIYHRLQLFYNNDVQFEMENMNPGLKMVILLPREG